MARRLRLQFAQKLRDIFALGRKSRSALSPLRLVAQQIPILLHRRAAPGGIDNHRVHFSLFKCRDHSLRQSSGLRFQARVQHERAATGLLAGNDHFASFRGKHARGGGIYAWKEDLLHAAGQHSNPAPWRTSGLNGRWQTLKQSRRNIGKQRLHGGQAFRQPLLNSHRRAAATANRSSDRRATAGPASAAAPDAGTSQTAIVERAARQRRAGCFAQSARASAR